MNRTIGLFLFLVTSISLISQTRTSLECLEREFHIVAHVITDSTFIPAASYGEVLGAINDLNKAWKPICVKFNLCEYRIDSNYNFSVWHQDTMETEYVALNYQPRIINIFIVQSIIKPVGAAGYATLGGIASRGKPVIVVAGAGGTLWIHEMGHYFGLKHPFEPTIANADNINCATLDDGVCDTPPDPDPSGAAHTDCVYSGAFKDANGKYYNPLVENYMSYYKGCTKSFTHMQYERMINTYKSDPQAKF
jgi:hypothetical protein